MATISRLYTFTNGSIADANEVNAELDQIIALLNGGIDDQNVSASAAIQGTKLADSPNGIPTAKINDKAVTGPKIANDPTVDASRAIGPDHLKDDAVISRVVATGAIIADGLAADAVIKSKIKQATFTNQPGGSIGANNSISINTTLSADDVIPLMAYLSVNTNPSGSLMEVVPHIWINNVGNIIHIVLTNAGAVLVSITGIDFKLLYVDAS